jgi:hypothetical protein
MSEIPKPVKDSAYASIFYGGFVGLVGLCTLSCGLIFTLSMLSSPDFQDAEKFLALCLLLVGIFRPVWGLAIIFIGYSLLKLKKWARIIAIFFAIIFLIDIPIGTVVGIILLVSLIKEESKRVFA